MKILITLNMASRDATLTEGGLVHQVMAEVDAVDFSELWRTLEKDRFLLVEEIYVYRHKPAPDGKKYQLAGQRLINIDHIGKIAPLTLDGDS